MILVDTSVWIDHFRNSNVKLRVMLEDAQVVCHPFVTGELACGNLANRTEILALLQALPQAQMAEHDEVLQFIDRRHLWTLDKTLSSIASQLKIRCAPASF